MEAKVREKAAGGTPTQANAAALRTPPRAAEDF